MTNWQAFWGGFWSFFEIRPFGEKPSFHIGGEEERFDVKQMREELGLNKNVWERIGRHFDRVGGYLHNAMGKLDEEIEKNDRKT